MTEFEKKLLEHLENQARQLTGLALSQSQMTGALLTISGQQAEILQELKKEPDSESVKDTLTKLLEPLSGHLNLLAKSFDRVSNVSEILCNHLARPPIR